jgi:hypothetical protein
MLRSNIRNCPGVFRWLLRGNLQDQISLRLRRLLMYVFFLPSMLALIVIGSIQLRDQFRFSMR